MERDSCKGKCSRRSGLNKKGVSNLQEMMKSVGELMLDANGRKVLTYLLVRRDQHFFCPDVIQVLQQGDSNPTRYVDVKVFPCFE